MNDNLINKTVLVDDQQVQVVYASFKKRLLAGLIDMIAILICALFVMGISHTLTSFLPANISGIIQTISIALIIILYFPLLESGEDQASFGKDLLKIKVINQDNTRITFANAFLRLLASLLSLLPFFAGYILIFYSKKNQSFHDLICKTYVIEKQDEQRIIR